MNKEFEALESLISKTGCMNDTCAHLDNCLKDNKCRYNDDNLMCPDYEMAKTLKNALTELKQIKEAKPSEAMEWLDSEIRAKKKMLEKFKDKNITLGINKAVLESVKDELKNQETIKNYILKAQELEKVSVIFKTKPFNMIYFVDEIRPDIYKHSYADYKTWFISKGGRTNDLLTEEEFNTLKRWSEK